MSKRVKGQSARVWHACVMKGEEMYRELRTEKENLEQQIAEARELLEWAQDTFIGPKVWQKSVNDWLERTK